MKFGSVCLGLAALSVLSATPAQAEKVDAATFSRAVDTCVRATSKLGVDDQAFIDGKWVREEIDGQPGDRYYSQGDLRASLGTRPAAGGSCIVSFNTKSAYTLAPLVAALEQDLRARVVNDSPSFAMLQLHGKWLLARVDPTPIGTRMVSVAVEMDSSAPSG